MAEENTEGYKVGPGKPPLETRFKPGESGNPNGVPKGTRQMRTIIREIFETEILAVDPKTNEPRKMTMGEAIAMAQFKQATKGNTKAFNALLDRLEGKVAQPLSGPNGEPLTGLAPLQVTVTGIPGTEEPKGA